MKIVTHKTVTTELTTIRIMVADGQGYMEVYWYDREEMSLCNLSVSPEARRTRIATRLMTLARTIAISSGSTSIYLWVRKDSWMHEWYKRLGYVDTEDFEEDPELTWMVKKLTKRKLNGNNT